MKEIVALEVEGELRNVTEVHLGTGFKQKGVMQSHAYPQGQNIRGYFGYEFLNFNTGIIKTYNGDAQAVLYFRDARALHADGGELLPVIVQQRFLNYQCEKCNQVLRYPTFRSTFIGIRIDRKTGKVTGFVKREGITKLANYRFRALLNWKRGKEYADEFIAACRKAEEEGIRLGSRKRTGKGLFIFDISDVRKITLADIKRRAVELKAKPVLTLHFLSDVVTDAITGELILTGVKNAGKFFHPEWRSYEDPFVRIRGKEMLKPRKVIFLERKEEGRRGKNKPMTEYAIPAGAKVTIEVSDAPMIFYECLAIAERCRGIGKRTSFGKGEFRIV